MTEQPPTAEQHEPPTPESVERLRSEVARAVGAISAAMAPGLASMEQAQAALRRVEEAMAPLRPAIAVFSESSVTLGGSLGVVTLRTNAFAEGSITLGGSPESPATTRVTSSRSTTWSVEAATETDEVELTSADVPYLLQSLLDGQAARAQGMTPAEVANFILNTVTLLVTILNVLMHR